MVILNKDSFGKIGFKHFIDYKDAKKIDLYAYFLKKWVDIEPAFMKLDLYSFNEKWWNIEDIQKNSKKN